MRLVLAISGLLLAAGNGFAADDEVDYSAPYVTLENGELVTRYRTKPHEASKQPLDADREAEISERDAASTAGALPALLIVIALAAASWSWRRRQGPR